MLSAQHFRDAAVAVTTDAAFTEAIVTFNDGSRLAFCHRVGERWAKAIGPETCDAHQAAQALAAMALFRLNAKHLDVKFTDGSQWVRRFVTSPQAPSRPDNASS